MTTNQHLFESSDNKAYFEELEKEEREHIEYSRNKHKATVTVLHILFELMELLHLSNFECFYMELVKFIKDLESTSMACHCSGDWRGEKDACILMEQVKLSMEESYSIHPAKYKKIIWNSEQGVVEYELNG